MVYDADTTTNGSTTGRIEPYELKGSRTVLRRVRSSDVFHLSDLIRFVYNIQLIYRKDIDKFLVNVFSIYEWTYLKALSNNDNMLFKTYDK